MQEEALNPSPATIAEAPAANQHATDPRLLKRIQILMWVTPICILLSIPAVIIASIGPDYPVASTIWVLLTYVFFYFMFHSIEKTLLLPLPNGKMPSGWLRGSGLKLRPHIYSMLNWVSLSFVLGVMMLIGPWLTAFQNWRGEGNGSSPNWDGASYGVSSLIGALIIYLLFSIVWTHPGSKIDRFFSTSWGKALIVTLAFAGYIVNFLILTYILISLI